MTPIVIWTCEHCDDTACEVATETGQTPKICPLNLTPRWRCEE